nr:UDP binding domain-containing protein [uncultured Thiohalocapsa sp.]
MESTTWPGTTDEALKPRLERNGLRVGTDLFLVFSLVDTSEHEDPGNPNDSTRTIPKVLGGSTPACTKVGQALYGQVIDQVVTLSSDDRRESPSIALVELLQAKGAEISDADPHVPKFLRMRKHDVDLESVPLTPETPAATDCVLLATDHDRFDDDMIKAHAPLIVDTRGRYQQPAEHIVKA